MLGSYIPVAVMMAVAAVLAVGMVVGSAVLGPKHPTKYKQSPYECGMTPVGSARERFPIQDAAIVHRLGRLAIGECSVAIAVCAPHRDAAFDACRWIIDTLKRDVPIWKKEIWTRGEATWVMPAGQ